MTYRPMVNARRDFDPMGEEWNYICDEYGSRAAGWRGMVPVNLRPFTWPYRLCTDRHGQNAYGCVRLAPDWCLYAWGNQYVLAGWNPAAEHMVNCRTVIERRYAPAGTKSDWPRDLFAGEGDDRWRIHEWAAYITLDLLAGTWKLDIRLHGKQADPAPPVPADVHAEAEHRAVKLLEFFRAECEHWKAGDQPRPVQAHDLYNPEN